MFAASGSGSRLVLREQRTTPPSTNYGSHGLECTRDGGLGALPTGAGPGPPHTGTATLWPAAPATAAPATVCSAAARCSRRIPYPAEREPADKSVSSHSANTERQPDFLKSRNPQPGNFFHFPSVIVYVLYLYVTRIHFASVCVLIIVPVLFGVLQVQMESSMHFQPLNRGVGANEVVTTEDATDHSAQLSQLSDN